MQQPDRPRMFIADDNAALRATLRDLVADAGVEVVGEAGDSSTALRTIPPLAYEVPLVILMDIRMPGPVNGIEATRLVIDRCERVAVIIFTAFPGAGIEQAARSAGAVELLAKHPLFLDLLTVDEARQLLRRRLGPDRVVADPRAVDDIIASCARLPLAIAIVGARAAINPTLPLAALASQLRDTRGSLDAFAGEDPATDVRAVLSWSYRAVSTGARRLFRLLGLHPGPDVAVPAAASLAGLPVGPVRAVLAELTRANLVAERAPGRYTVHDLLRAYAIELAGTEETEAERRAAQHRMLDHYLHSANAAALLLHPHRDPIAPAPPQPGAVVARLAGHEQALAWFTGEHAVLLAAVGRAAATGFDTHAWQLVWTLAEYFDRQGHWHDWVAARASRRPGEGPQPDRLVPRAARGPRADADLLRAGPRPPARHRRPPRRRRHLGQPRLRPPPPRAASAGDGVLPPGAGPLPGVRRPLQRGGVPDPPRRHAPRRRGVRRRAPGLARGPRHPHRPRPPGRREALAPPAGGQRPGGHRAPLTRPPARGRLIALDRAS